MPKLLSSLIVLLLVLCGPARGQGRRQRAETGRRAAAAPLVILDSTKEGDGLKGPVRRIETEVFKVGVERGVLTEKSRALLERTLYDEQGRRVENETYPVVGSRAGREAHSYDAQGNLAETVVRDERGAVLSRVVYEYEFDQFGNWIKMTASVAVLKSGAVEYEPAEVTKRAITYYHVGGVEGRNATPAASAGGAPHADAVKVGARAETASGPAGARAETPSAEPRAEPTPNQPGGAGVIYVGVLNERATAMPEPAFPVGSERLGEPVTVTVEVVIDITGRVVSARARGGPGALRESAERAARRAVFLPFYAGGRPVKARGLLNYTFDFLP